MKQSLHHLDNFIMAHNKNTILVFLSKISIVEDFFHMTVKVSHIQICIKLIHPILWQFTKTRVTNTSHWSTKWRSIEKHYVNNYLNKISLNFEFEMLMTLRDIRANARSSGRTIRVSDAVLPMLLSDVFSGFFRTQ